MNTLIARIMTDEKTFPLLSESYTIEIPLNWWQRIYYKLTGKERPRKIKPEILTRFNGEGVVTIRRPYAYAGR